MTTTNNELIIRDIQSKDLDELLKLALTTPEIHTQIGEPEYYSKSQLQGFIENEDAIFLGVFANDTLAGFSITTYDKFAKEAYFINMVVREGYRRMGIGQQLYEATLALIKNKDCKWMWVLTEEDNQKMQNFLEKHEFEKGPKFIYYRKDLS